MRKIECTINNILISLSFIVFIISPNHAMAQPDTKKVSKSMFTLKTFNAEGALLSSSNGFYVGPNGEAVSNFEPFVNAHKAVIIDVSGKEYPVECMLGANYMYDVAKFRVSTKKSIPVSLATSTEDAAIWIIPFKGKNTFSSIEAKIIKAEKIQKDYDYYTINIATPDEMTSCPAVNSNGDVVGMIQKSAKDNATTTSAISSLFANDLKLTGLSLNSSEMKSTFIKADIPDNYEQAQLMLYIAESAYDSLRLESVITDFIQKYPSSTDGYISAARQAYKGNRFADIDNIIENGLKKCDKKDDLHFNFGRMIFMKEVYKESLPYPAWSLDKAFDEATKAYSQNPNVQYRQLQADILFTQRKYDEAFDMYMDIATTQKTPVGYYQAARCKEQQHDTTTVIALLDSAIATFSKPYLKEAASYLFIRAQWHIKQGEYRKAVADYNDYEMTMGEINVNDGFYFLRYQAELEGRMFQQALNDITKALNKSPNNTEYMAEKASLEIRVGYYDKAMETARQIISLEATNSDGALFLGLAQCLAGNKSEGIKNLNKAKELGDTQAQSLIDKYGK